ncbi:ASCH domain-containing protein [Rothia sp. HC945]|uniref:ASCH domain-containing protein n=1 Tax=Rothia sp. HC945 TaxID=3171170 RepID=UPI002651AFAD|nr:ASCH domain-containing protein [Kocuria sp.]MDN5618180.1 ASCH domain-containing protein [Kocuria sp.]
MRDRLHCGHVQGATGSPACAVLDGSGTARAVLRTTRVDVVPFERVGEDHALAEGEGDRTLAFWRGVHRDFFERFASHDRGFRQDMPVVCERFRMVYPEVRA